MSSKMVTYLRLLRATGLSNNLSICKQIHTSSSLGSANPLSATSTIDEEDVKRHTKLLKEWWDPHGPQKALHSFNLIRVPFIRDGLVDCSPNERTLKPLKGKCILDVGCGGGIVSEPLARLGAQVTGIDASKELVELATSHSEHLKDNQPKYICTSIEEHVAIKDHKEMYDAVVASEIIEHVAEKELFTQSCVQALKPGGRIFFTTPNRTRIAELTVIFLAENIFKVVPRGTHQIDKFITPPELSLLLERNQCQVELTHGIFYNVFTNTWSWSTFDHFTYALQAVKLESCEKT